MLVEVVVAASLVTGFVWALNAVTRSSRRYAWSTAAFIFMYVVVRGVLKWRTTPSNSRTELMK